MTRAARSSSVTVLHSAGDTGGAVRREHPVPHGDCRDADDDVHRLDAVVLVRVVHGEPRDISARRPLGGRPAGRLADCRPASRRVECPSTRPRVRRGHPPRHATTAAARVGQFCQTANPCARSHAASFGSMHAAIRYGRRENPSTRSSLSLVPWVRTNRPDCVPSRCRSNRSSGASPVSPTYQAPAVRAAGIPLPEGAVLPHRTIEFDGVDRVMTP